MLDILINIMFFSSLFLQRKNPCVLDHTVIILLKSSPYIGIVGFSSLHILIKSLSLLVFLAYCFFFLFIQEEKTIKPVPLKPKKKRLVCIEEPIECGKVESLDDLWGSSYQSVTQTSHAILAFQPKTGLMEYRTVGDTYHKGEEELVASLCPASVGFQGAMNSHGDLRSELVVDIGLRAFTAAAIMERVRGFIHFLPVLSIITMGLVFEIVGKWLITTTAFYMWVYWLFLKDVSLFFVISLVQLVYVVCERGPDMATDIFALGVIRIVVAVKVIRDAVEVIRHNIDLVCFLIYMQMRAFAPSVPTTRFNSTPPTPVLDKAPPNHVR